MYNLRHPKCILSRPTHTDQRLLSRTLTGQGRVSMQTQCDLGRSAQSLQAGIAFKPACKVSDRLIEVDFGPRGQERWHLPWNPHEWKMLNFNQLSHAPDTRTGIQEPNVSPLNPRVCDEVTLPLPVEKTTLSSLFRQWSKAVVGMP